MEAYPLTNFTNQYRVTKHGSNDPWDFTIPGTRGHVYVHSSTELGLSLDDCKIVIGRVKADADFRILQDGDDGANFAFTPSDETMARAKVYAKLRVRRNLSEELRVKLIRRLWPVLLRDAAQTSISS